MQTSRENIIRLEKNQYSITRLNKNNLGDLVRLYSEIYGIPKTSDYFAKKYDTTYCGVDGIGYIIYDDANRPIAFFGIIPCFLKAGEELILAGQAVDGMTHPKYHGRGIFVKLCEVASALSAELGIRLLFGFPNEHSYPPMINQLGWSETGKMARFRVSTDTNWGKFLFQNSRTEPEDRSYELFPPTIGFGNSVIADGFIGVHRSMDYMKYKSFSDSAVIKMGSGDLWAKVGKKQLVIGDIILTGNTKKKFFEELKAVAKKLNSNEISFQVSNGCSLYDLFASRYRPIESFPILLKDLGSGLPLDKIKFTFADIDIF